MATENPGQIVSRIAGTGLINKRFVVEVPGGIVDLNTVAGGPCDGVVAMISYGTTGTTITAGDAAPICKDHDCIVESGGVVADGDEVMSDTTGRAVTFVVDGAAVALGQVVNGTSATAAGQDLTVELYEKAQRAGVLIS